MTNVFFVEGVSWFCGGGGGGGGGFLVTSCIVFNLLNSTLLNNVLIFHLSSVYQI